MGTDDIRVFTWAKPYIGPKRLNFGSSGEPIPRTEYPEELRFLRSWNQTGTELFRFWFLRYRFSVTSVRFSGFFAQPDVLDGARQIG
jgi:hypothetical protein